MITSQKHLTPEEQSQLIASLGWGRDSLIIRLALATGCRQSELLLLTTANLIANSQSVLILPTKNSNPRDIPLPADLFTALARLPSGKLFPISSRHLRRIWDHHRPSRKGFHCLRHTFAIGLYRRTKDIRLVKAALGHKSIANTMVYADYCYTADEFRKALVVPITA